jgi:hypothetical protein
MIIQFLECDVHTGREAIIKDVISNTLGLCLFHEESFIVDTTCNHCIKDSHNDASHSLNVCQAWNIVRLIVVSLSSVPHIADILSHDRSQDYAMPKHASFFMTEVRDSNAKAERSFALIRCFPIGT